MDRFNLLMTRVYVEVLMAPRTRDERGDVPGWVMITVMTAAIVVVIWGVADEQLGKLLASAFEKVSGKAKEQ